jgi:hypothetical protein
MQIDRKVVEQALEALKAMHSYAAAERKGLRICDESITALKAALAEPNRAQQQRDAGYTRRPTLREMAALEQPQQAVPYDVWRQGFDAVRKYKEDNHD